MKKLIPYRLPLTTDDKGVALILTFIFMVSLTVITAAYLFLVTYGTRNVGAQANNGKALLLAEAGLNKAVWYLTNTAPDSSTDGSWRTTAYPADPGPDPTDPQQESLGEGTYTMWVETSGSDILVTARGTVNGIERTIQETVTLSSVVPEAFSYLQHSEDDTNFKDSDGDITGDLSAGGNVKNESGMTITGTITESSTVSLPTVDMDSYAAIADTTVSGNKTFTSGTYSGIWYVDGKATVKDNVTFNGTIVATGDIVLTNTDNFTANPTSNYPALVSEGKINGDKMKDANIAGLVYATGNIQMNDGKDNTITGTIISGNKINIKDGEGWTLTYDSDIVSDPPPYFSESGAGGATGDDWKEI